MNVYVLPIPSQSALFLDLSMLLNSLSVKVNKICILINDFNCPNLTKLQSTSIFLLLNCSTFIHKSINICKTVSDLQTSFLACVCADVCWLLMPDRSGSTNKDGVHSGLYKYKIN